LTVGVTTPGGIRLVPALQRYEWGSPTEIPRLLPDVVADGGPFAEAWFGTHPVGPARTDDGRSLRDVAGPLPYLVKVLTAAAPLSIQTHPDEATAARRFAEEEAAGIALTAPHRLYRDPYAKPELVCAITEFDALCGFRPAEEIADHLADIGLGSWAGRLQRDGLASTFGALFASAPRAQASVVERAVAGSPFAAELAQHHPGDIGVVAALFLRRVTLLPGDALFLAAGNVHAYLSGSAVEVMSSSDNVLRAGLTVKHVDAEELLSVVRFSTDAVPVVRPDADGRYLTHDVPFAVRHLPAADTVTGPATVLELPGHGTFVPAGVTAAVGASAWVIS
jgi:mannose-6-phosphate isomerase